MFAKLKSDSEEYQAACRLWQVYLQTRAEFVQPGDGDDEEEDGEDIVDNSGMSAEEEVDYIAAIQKKINTLNAHLNFLW